MIEIKSANTRTGNEWCNCCGKDRNTRRIKFSRDGNGGTAIVLCDACRDELAHLLSGNDTALSKIFDDIKAEIRDKSDNGSDESGRMWVCDALEIVDKHQRNVASFLKSVSRKDGEKMVALKDTNPGDVVMIAGEPSVVLDKDFRDGVFCLTKGILHIGAFDKDNCNNWKTSSTRARLNGHYLRTLEEVVGAENILEFERDLTSDDGLKDYGTCRDKISLITCDEYRRYRYQIGERTSGEGGDWWWTATACTTLPSYSSRVRVIESIGDIGSANAYSEMDMGVAPCLCLSPDLEVELIEEGANRRLVGGTE